MVTFYITMIHFHIITLFPSSIEPYTSSSMLGRAQRDGKIKVTYYNPRDFTTDKHKRIDNKPYGGGPGMVLEATAFLRATQKAIGRKKNVEVIFFSPSGKQFDSKMARKLAKLGGRTPKSKHIVMLCGHYEGVDGRVAKILKAKQISIGPFVLTGGELPAAVVVDAVARHVQGVLGSQESLEEERTASPEVYTRPEVLIWKKKKHKVPKVLLSGHHANIEEWKQKKQKK